MNYFNEEQYLNLLYFLLAHLLADFVLQSRKMVENKHWFSRYMLLHIGIVFGTSWLFTGKLIWATLVAVLHYAIDSAKVLAERKNWGNQQNRFLGDQLLHILSILAIWAGNTEAIAELWLILKTNWFGIKGSVIILGYILVIWPTAYLIRFTTAELQRKSQQEAKTEDTERTLEHGGKLIGQFERIIILTLVLLGEYQAIGFLITGKSILRFTDRNGKYFSEYVLVGTMMSYALAIILGVLINIFVKTQ